MLVYEIWIVRIDPTAREGTPGGLDDIADRRNELAGNLSLEQEKHVIESINDLVESGTIDHERYKRIDLREIELDVDLDIHSKLNRDPDFLETLMDRGAEVADRFWTRAEVTPATISR